MLSKIKRGLSVGFFGIGRSNLSLLSSLPLENCTVTLRSDGYIDPKIYPGARILTGEDATSELTEDILFLSPSVRRDRFPADKRHILSSDYELFLSECRKPIFAVTGSDGKSSTARILTMLLSESGIRAREVGNMGEPMFASLRHDADIYVAELSSYMLSTAQPMAEVACLTSLTPNHIDWHKSYENYKKTKISLLKRSKKYVISDENADIKGAYAIISLTRSFAELRQIYDAQLYLTVEGGQIMKNGEALIPLNRIKRREGHNLKNLMTAVAMAEGYYSEEALIRVAESFSGLPHRCEKLIGRGGIDCYDSSIDTSPARTATTLRSLGREVVIILGGRGKGLDYRLMLPEVEEYVRFAVLVGENKNEIYRAIGDRVSCVLAEDFASAVALGLENAREVGALLLSPASASYDLFPSYEIRGETFKKLVNKGFENEADLS